MASPSPPQGDLLKLGRQLCFPLYAASRLTTRLYQPHLEPLGLTYPQYVVLMILWEDAPCSVSHIGKRAMLKSNTLTPLLKKLEKQGFVSRARDRSDERMVSITLTREGEELKSKCSCIPSALLNEVYFSEEKALQLKTLLAGLINAIQNRSEP